MKNIVFCSAWIALFVSVGFVNSSCGSPQAKVPQKDTVVVNTTEIGKDITGYNGPTPVEIKLVDGVIVGVKALENTESPGFFQRVLESGLLESVVGKTAAEAAEMPLDAVSGATFSSKAVIANLRAGLATVTDTAE